MSEKDEKLTKNQEGKISHLVGYLMLNSFHTYRSNV